MFLDYDGTLTPIVSDPDAATLSDHMRDAVGKLSDKATVAIVSGRAREKLRNFVQLPELYYAGSHGFDIDGPGGAFAASSLIYAVVRRRRRCAVVACASPASRRRRRGVASPACVHCDGAGATPGPRQRENLRKSPLNAIAAVSTRRRPQASATP